MNTQSRHLLGPITEFFGRHFWPGSVRFAEHELVKSSEDMRVWPIFGAYLGLPPNVAAVVTSRDGQQSQYRTGGLLNLPHGLYSLQYVDMRQQRTILYDIHADTLDAWQVTLTLEIIWQVRSPLQVIAIHRPWQAFTNECRAAAINFIQSHNHDTLIPARQSTPLEDTEISEAIQNQVRASPTFNGFQLLGIKVLERRGDPLRLDKIRASNEQLTTYEQTILVENEKLKLELQKVQQELMLVQQGRDVDLERARTRMLVERTEAEMQAEIFKITLAMREKTIELENAARAQALRQEQIIEGMKMIKDFAEMFVQMQMNPGLQRTIDDSAMRTMMQLVQSMLQSSSGGDAHPLQGKFLPPVRPRSLDS